MHIINLNTNLPFSSHPKAHFLIALYVFSLKQRICLQLMCLSVRARWNVLMPELQMLSKAEALHNN